MLSLKQRIFTIQRSAVLKRILTQETHYTRNVLPTETYLVKLRHLRMFHKILFTRKLSFAKQTCEFRTIDQFTLIYKIIIVVRDIGH